MNTDRILYKHQSTTQVNPLHYDSVQDVTTSDHKPVWGIWEVKIRPGKDNVPLSGGLFNREVYLEGLKRRSEALHPPSAGKMNCNIQWSCLLMNIWLYLQTCLGNMGSQN